ncbi:MAG TPA: cation:proton antiporter [Polyangia bacterium]|jgi:Kef-type K+ transport system membrane component KefB
MTLRWGNPPVWLGLGVLAGGLLVAVPAHASAGHADPVTPVVLGLAVVLAAAKVAGDLSVRVGQPPVLGELCVGVLLGNLHLLGVPWLEFVKQSETLDILARIGVIVLLFEVGLESTVRDMLRVGWSSLLVAVLGVVTPFALGWGASSLLLPGRSVYVHAFIGATLTATSVGITARVLKDLGRAQTRTARVILGAAVIDDILGLVILAVVSGAIAAAAVGGSASVLGVTSTVGKAMVFLFGSLALGVALSPRLFRFTSRMRGGGAQLITALVFCFVLAYLSAFIGLAPIVGAYAAGLILEPVHFRPFVERGEQQLEELISPIATFLVPVFFVLMGMNVDLSAFTRAPVIGLAALLTAAAILGKQACSLGAVGSGVDRLSIGLGMVPRGEVGLIFANVGLHLSLGGERIIDEGIFSAVVMMVIVTTVVTPPALGWSLRRGERLRAAAEEEQEVAEEDGALLSGQPLIPRPRTD